MVYFIIILSTVTNKSIYRSSHGCFSWAGNHCLPLKNRGEKAIFPTPFLNTTSLNVLLEVRINGLFHLLISGIYWGYKPLTTHTIHGTAIFTYIWLIFMVIVGRMVYGLLPLILTSVPAGTSNVANVAPISWQVVPRRQHQQLRRHGRLPTALRGVQHPRCLRRDRRSRRCSFRVVVVKRVGWF